MEKNEVERIVRETIEHANMEIKKAKRRSMCLAACVLLVLTLAYQTLFHYEIPVAYREGLVSVVIPVDRGIDIHVELRNYQKANAVLVKTGDDTYDLYIGIMQTVATKIFKDFDTANNFLRVGNGIIFDHQGEQLLGHLPAGSDEEVIQHIYYLDDLSEKVAVMTDQALMDMENKTLIWERNS